MIPVPPLFFATDLLLLLLAIAFAGFLGFGIGLAGFAGARRTAYRDFIIAHQRSVAVRAARTIERLSEPSR